MEAVVAVEGVLIKSRSGRNARRSRKDFEMCLVLCIVEAIRIRIEKENRVYYEVVERRERELEGGRIIELIGEKRTF